MKMLHDYTPAELLELDEKGIARLIDLECADDGVPLMPTLPKAPTKPEVGPTVEAFTVEGVLRFETRKEANEVLRWLRQNKLLETYYVRGEYRFSSSNPEGVRPSTEDTVKVTSQMYWEPEIYDQSRHVLEAYHADKKTWETAKRERDKIAKKREGASDSVRGAVDRAREDRDVVLSIKATFAEYCDLADGDEKIALGFLLKGKVWDETLVRETLGIEPEEQPNGDQEDTGQKDQEDN